MLAKLKPRLFLYYGFLFISILALLNGCAEQPIHRQPKPATTTQQISSKHLWNKRLNHFNDFNNWQMSGRIAVYDGHDGGNATFVWKQVGNYYHVRFFGPFGAGAVLIEGNAKQVSLKEANGKVHYATTPEALMHKVAGWHVPLSGMRYWILGIPTPQSSISGKLLNPDGVLNLLDQSGWHIEFENYVTQFETQMPSKLNMANGNLKVKIIIKSWQNS